MIARVQEKKIATVRDRGEMYKAVAQLVLIYGRKSWVVTGEMRKALMAFHHWVVRKITGMTAKRGAGGEWDYPEAEKAIDSVRLHPIEA